VKMDPFIEAEEAAGHSPQRCCDLFEVSRAAYYERKKNVPSARALGDAELTERITKVHTESKGTYGYLRVHKALRKDGVEVGKRRVRRLCARRVSKAGRRNAGARPPWRTRKPKKRKTSSNVTSVRVQRSTDATSVTSPTS
jgi:HTH-like domain